MRLTFPFLDADHLASSRQNPASVRHAADLGYIPVIVRDACGAGHEEAAQRSMACVEYSGDAVFTDVETICNVLTARQPG